MPNYTFNELAVIGSNQHLDEFAMGVKTPTQELSFEKIIPTPKGLDQPNYQSLKTILTLQSNSVNPPLDWYTWRVLNWGTKWDINPENLTMLRVKQGCFGKPTLYYEFDTAWSPPLTMLGHASVKYPNCAFRLRWQNEFESKKEQVYMFLGEESTAKETLSFLRKLKIAKKIPTDKPTSIISTIPLV